MKSVTSIVGYLATTLATGEKPKEHLYHLADQYHRWRTSHPTAHVDKCQPTTLSAACRR